jgi:hypothetical protein
METARFCKDDLNLKINIFVPADDVERPVESIPNPDNIIFDIFDFKKIITKPARKYVEITIVEYDDEHTFDIENEGDAHRVIKEFIVKKEKSPELVFQVGFCENPRCVKWLESDDCCKHRLAGFDYDDDYTYIIGYSETIYRIKIIL